MEIKTERLIIRNTDRETANRISTLNNGNETDKTLASLSSEDISIIFEKPDEVEKIIARLSCSLGNGESDIYGAWLDTRFVGFIALVNCKSELPEVQIEIAPEYQNQGYGYEFLFSLLKELFREGKYTQLRYTVLPTNEASINLITKIGAFLQEPESIAEEKLFKTYHISKLSMDAYEAHAYSNNHKAALEKDNLCGCFCCLEMFHPSKIDEWIIDDNQCDYLGTAICPYCEIDSVIGESSGYPITKEFLAAMNKIWFL